MTSGEIQTRLLESEINYTGAELRPHYILSQHKIQGSALIAFIGACDVKTDHLVDWEDRLNNDSIKAAKMVHFIGEFFQSTLREGVLRQRLLMSIIHDVLLEKLPKVEMKRSGDDLFVGDRKLSVSIVTSSPVSQLLHAAINLDPAGAPVKAIGVIELGLQDFGWVKEVLTRFAEEWVSIEQACTKVRPVM